MGLAVQKKGRLEFLDIAKGIGILLVVWAHAKGPFTSYMYQFHMPLFFLISGYLFNSKNTPKQFIIKKIQSLYIPFVVWNILSVVLRSVFHIREYTGSYFWKKIIRIMLTLDKDGDFFGATWFLGALFLVSVCYKLMDYYIPCVKSKSIILALLFGSVAILGFEVTFPYLMSRTMILSFFFAAGRAIKDWKEQLSVYDTRALFSFSVLIFIVIGYYNSINMGANKYSYPILFVIGAFFASYATVYISKIVERRTVRIKNILSFLGEKSIHIVIWQFVAFRIVAVIQLYMDQVPVSQMMDFYPPYKTTGGLWIIYTVVGLAVPVPIGEITSGLSRIVMRRK